MRRTAVFLLLGLVLASAVTNGSQEAQDAKNVDKGDEPEIEVTAQKGDKPGQCEDIPTFVPCGVDPEPDCKSDWDCEGNQKCCNYACEMQCRDPIGEKPGECEEIPTFKECDEDPDPDCNSDWDCDGSMKCCNYACDIQCREPKA